MSAPRGRSQAALSEAPEAVEAGCAVGISVLREQVGCWMRGNRSWARMLGQLGTGRVPWERCERRRGQTGRQGLARLRRDQGSKHSGRSSLPGELGPFGLRIRLQRLRSWTYNSQNSQSCKTVVEVLTWVLPLCISSRFPEFIATEIQGVPAEA